VCEAWAVNSGADVSIFSGTAAGTPGALPEARAFHTTHWSLVTAARGTGEAKRMAAMERLCRTYWQPLYWFARRKGHGAEEARDLTQGFFAKFIGKDYIRSVDADRGRFRSWLLSAMQHFLLDEYRASQRQKRGGGCEVVPLDEALPPEGEILASDWRTPEVVYEQQWVQALLATVLARLRTECAEAGRAGHFDALKPFLTGGQAPVAETAAALGLSEGAARSAIHRLRVRYGQIFREEVANTLTDLFKYRRQRPASRTHPQWPGPKPHFSHHESS
jgi:RNA polymerase sigma factor (sigma-70 family)